MLGPIPTLSQYINNLDWVLVGGESCDENPEKARPMQPAWAKEVKKICETANVPFHFKQWGSQKPVAVNTDGSIQFKAMKRWEAGRTFLGKNLRRPSGTQDRGSKTSKAKHSDAHKPLQETIGRFNGYQATNGVATETAQRTHTLVPVDRYKMLVNFVLHHHDRNLLADFGPASFGSRVSYMTG